MNLCSNSDSTKPTNLLELLDWRVEQSSIRTAYQYPDANGGWGHMTWLQVKKRVRIIAGKLIDLGVKPDDRVAIMSSTRIEWALTAFAILETGATIVAIYPQTKTDTIEHIVADAGIKLAVVENQTILERVLAGNYDHPLQIVLFDDDTKCRYQTLRSLTDPSAEANRALDEYRNTIESQTIATIIYTSGTSCLPKGVMLTHGNWLAEATSLARTKIVDENDVEYFWLPLAHSFGMALLFGHVAIGFLKYVDGSVDSARIAANLQDIQPTFMAGPPRTFEKIADGVKQRIADSPWPTRLAYNIAMFFAKRKYNRNHNSYHPAWPSSIVFKKLSASFGGRLRLFASGGAALGGDVVRLFDLWGKPVLQGYGLTETCGGSAIGSSTHHPAGSVGWALPGTEVKIANGSHEILLRGPHIMVGYFNDQAATDRAITPDGWFHTGDKGEIRYSGGNPALYVTGRIKDAGKLSTGKYVSPEKIETHLTATGIVAHAVVVVEGRKFASALVSLDTDAVLQWAKRQKISGDYPSLIANKRLQAAVQDRIDDVNARLEKWEKVVKFAIVPVDFSKQDGGFLTPSNKVRRDYVLATFESLVEEMYL